VATISEGIKLRAAIVVRGVLRYRNQDGTNFILVKMTSTPRIKPREKIRTANFGAGGRSSAGHATSDGMTLHTYLQTKCSISVSERCSKSYTTFKKAFAIKLM
jgi:hypothetical protein